jgi:steroid delta-isomerase-like uncharacterized protein
VATDMKELVKDWFAAWNSHDPEKVARCYTLDATFESVAAGRVSHGKTEMIPNLEAYFFDYPDFRIEQQTTIICENAVCGEVIVSATQVNSSDPAMPATGKRFSVRGAYISEWQNGKVKRHAYYQDQLGVIQQLGLLPGAPGKK